MRRAILLTVVLAAAAVGPLGAQSLADYDYENLSFRGVGLAAGYIWPTVVEPTYGLSARIDLGYLGPGVRLVPTLGYWSSTLRVEETDRLKEQLGTVKDFGAIEWTSIALGADGHFVWTTPVHLLTYVGIGAELHALNGDGPTIDGTFVEGLMDGVSAGVAAMGGLEYEVLDRVRIYGEARYTLLGDLRYAGVRIGGAYMLSSQGGTGD